MFDPAGWLEFAAAAEVRALEGCGVVLVSAGVLFGCALLLAGVEARAGALLGLACTCVPTKRKRLMTNASVHMTAKVRRLQGARFLVDLCEPLKKIIYRFPLLYRSIQLSHI